MGRTEKAAPKGRFDVSAEADQRVQDNNDADHNGKHEALDSQDGLKNV